MAASPWGEVVNGTFVIAGLIARGLDPGAISGPGIPPAVLGVESWQNSETAKGQKGKRAKGQKGKTNQL